MNLFVLKTINIEKKSKDDLRKEWVINNIKYDRYCSFEKFLDTCDSLYEKDYTYDSYENSYYDSLEIAKEYVLSGLIGSDDSNYLAIIEVPINKSHGITSIENIYIFKYNYDNHIFEEISATFDEETMLIVNMNACNYVLHKNN